MIKLRSTFRTSLQCHREAVSGSIHLRSSYNFNAVLLSSAVGAGSSEIVLYNDNWDSDSILSAIRREGDGADDVAMTSNDEVGLPARRSGKSRCCIQ
jgi:hypothetical protein